jgi:carboxyl-terminal processing protease
VEESDLPKVVGGLYTADLFYDYANRYRWTHDSIPPADKFVITEAIYQDFMAFVKDKQFDYDTESMAKLKELVEATKKERYYDHAKGAIDGLEKELAPDRTEDMSLFRKDIEEVLKNEIVARYYFQTGRYVVAMNDDPYVKKALEVLNGGTLPGILNGTIKGQ